MKHHIPTHTSKCPFPFPHIRIHLESPEGSLGFSPFSICSTISSNALVTFSLYRALASVKTHLNFSANSLPCSAVTWRCSGRRSLLLPTIVIGTQSVPCEIISNLCLESNVKGESRFPSYQVVQDFILDDLHHFKRLHWSNGIDKHIAMNTNKVLWV